MIGLVARTPLSFSKSSTLRQSLRLRLGVAAAMAANAAATVGAGSAVEKMPGRPRESRRRFSSDEHATCADATR
eukprot:3704149-Pleurochrysis_carterae.AAC.1